METQDHKKTNQSGHEGHGGVHVCHKCGWPFPNPHPSARHRRAHKRVCGTVEGYKLDNSSQKVGLDGSDDEQRVSDDEHKTPSSGKVVERTISRKSSSGVGSRSSRSTRSEDEVFADAATDFVDIPGPEEPSDGGIERWHSLQRITESGSDGTKQTVENAIADADDLCSPNISGDSHAQTVQISDGDNDKVEASVLSLDHTSISTAKGKENVVDPDITTEKGTHVVSSEDPSELRTSYSESDEQVSKHIDASSIVHEEPLQTSASEDMLEGSHEVDSPGKSDALTHSVEVIDDSKGITSKSRDMTEERDSEVEANENVYVLSVPDGLPLQEQHPEIAVEDLDHKGGRLNISKPPPDCTLTVENLDIAKPSGSNNDSSEDYVPNDVYFMEAVLKQEKTGEGKSIVEPNTVGASDEISDAKASNAEFNDFRSEVLKEEVCKSLEDQKVGLSEEQELIVKSENISSEGTDVYGLDNQDIKTSIGDRSEFSSEVLKHNESETSEDQKIGFSEVQEHIVLSENISSQDTDVYGADNQDIKASYGDVSKFSCEVLKYNESETSEDQKTGFSNVQEHIVLSENISSEGTDVYGADNQDIKASSGDVSEFSSEVLKDNEIETSEDQKIGSSEVQETIVPSEKLPSAGANVNDADNQEFSSNKSDIAKIDEEDFTVLENDGSKVPAEVSVQNSTLAERAVNDSASPVKELTSAHGSNDMGDDEKHRVEGIVLSGNETSIGGEDESKVVSAETSPFEQERDSQSMEERECLDKEGANTLVKSDNDLDSTSKMTQTSVEVFDDGSLESSAAVEESFTKTSADKGPGVVEGDKVTKQEDVSAPVGDVFVDSCSQSDSIDGNWGSVSDVAVSAISDAFPTSNDLIASAESVNTNLKHKAAEEGQHSESKSTVKPKTLEFQTPVEPEIELEQTQQQQQSSALQTGGSRSVTDVAGVPPLGGERNSEIIAKVTNWDSNSGKHLSLKTLLGEATDRSRAESPNHDEIPVKNNGVSAKTEKAGPNSEEPKLEMGKEWNSPARYPVNIKTEKRRAKSKPYWVPFLCCSSVNAR